MHKTFTVAFRICRKYGDDGGGTKHRHFLAVFFFPRQKLNYFFLFFISLFLSFIIIIVNYIALCDILL